MSCGLERVATWRGADLMYQRCQTCGRCGCWQLVRDGRVLAHGLEAQRQFEAEKERAA